MKPLLMLAVAIGLLLGYFAGIPLARKLVRWMDKEVAR